MCGNVIAKGIVLKQPKKPNMFELSRNASTLMYERYVSKDRFTIFLTGADEPIVWQGYCDGCLTKVFWKDPNDVI